VHHFITKLNLALTIAALLIAATHFYLDYGPHGRVEQMRTSSKYAEAPYVSPLPVSMQAASPSAKISPKFEKLNNSTNGAVLK
jgi:hypothetical protein